MASPCLYINIGHNSLKGRTWPNPGNADDLRIDYTDLPETEEDTPQVTRALNELLANPSLAACSRAVVTIPAEWVWFRYTTLPFNDRKKLEQILPLELATDYPDPDAPVLLDFKTAQHENTIDGYAVFSGSLVESKIKDIFTPLSERGISLALITPGGIAQALIFCAGRPEAKDCLFAHISQTKTTLTLIHDGFPLMVRTISMDRPMAISPRRTLALEIKKTLTSAGFKPGIEIEALHQIPVCVSHAHKDAAVEGLDTTLKETWPEWNGAFETVVPGAIAGQITPDRYPQNLLNFCVGPYKTDSFYNQYKGRLVLTALLLALVFGLAVFDLYQKNQTLETRIFQTRNASTAIYQQTFPDSKKTPVQAPLMLMQSKVKQARQSRNGKGTALRLPGNGPSVSDLLHELSSRIPGNIDVEVTRFSLNRDRLIITGLTANFNDVDRIKGLIQASPRFKTVSIQSAETDKTGKKVRFKFILET